MPATDVQLRAALLSDDPAQRWLAASHIERARPELFPLMLEVLRESRPVEAHDHLPLTAARMVRDEPMLDAFIELLPVVRENWVDKERYLGDPISQIVRDAPPDLLLSRHDQLRPLCAEPYADNILRGRIGWLRREPATCLRALEAFGRRYASHRDSTPEHDVEYAIESAARDVELSRDWFSARLERLSVLPDEFPEGELYWLAHLAIDLAGHAGLREGVPLMLDCLGTDDDLLHESCHHALLRLMDAEVLRSMDERFTDATGWPRMSFASIAADRPLPEASGVFARWLDISYEGDELGNIASHALHLLDAELLPAVNRVVVGADWDMMYCDLAAEYLAACAILGAEPAQPSLVERARTRAQRRKDRLFGGLSRLTDDDAEVVPPSEPVNRIKAGPNEPCPCGSGHKFKKCCMNKSAVNG